MRRVLYRLNSTAPNCISSRRSAGKLFHTRGPATEKLLCAKQVAECLFPYLDLVWCTYPVVL